MAQTFIERLPDAELGELRDQAEAREDWDVVQRCEDEIERRDYDASDPASPQNTAEDARDTSLTD